MYGSVRTILIIWRYYKMARNTANVVKGVGAGLVAGMVFGFAGSAMMKDNKKCRKKAAKAMDTVEEFIDGVKDIFTKEYFAGGWSLWSPPAIFLNDPVKKPHCAICLKEGCKKLSGRCVQRTFPKKSNMC